MRFLLLAAFLAVSHGAALDRFLSIKAVSMWPDNNFKRIVNTSPEECAQKCLDGFYANCKSFRFKVEHLKCDLLAIAPDDEVNVLSASSQGWDFYIMQADFEGMEDAVKELTQQVEWKQTQITALTKEKEELSKAVDYLQTAETSKTEELNRLREQLTQKTEELEATTDEHAQLSSDLEVAVAEQKKTIATLEGKVSELQEEIADMEEDDTPRPQHCWEIYKTLGLTKDGIYKIYPFGPQGRGIDVSCVSGWTVFHQRNERQVVAENFDRNWTDYQNGFGVAAKEFWLGLEALTALTSSQQMSLKVEMKFSFAYYARMATYRGFRVYDKSQNYKLSIWGFWSQTLYDYMKTGNGYPFSTKDKDNSPGAVCMKSNKGGWWFKAGPGWCRRDNLNAPDRSAIRWNGSVSKVCRWCRLSIKPY